MDVEKSLDYLASAECFDSLRKDPYWPKWHSPWWHMTLLWELGLGHRIPKAAAVAQAEAMDRRWQKIWLESEGFSGDDQLDVGCFCAIGIMEQVLRSAGVELKDAAPWLPDWPRKYVLPDGGVNCDADVYAAEGSKRSSYQSTIAVAEAVLSRPALTAADEKFLDGAANYFIIRKLFRTSGGEVVDLGWLQPKFPRFYDYDALRGLRFLTRWSKRLGRTVPPEAVAEAMKHLPKFGPVSGEPADCLSHNGGQGRPATWFPLLLDCMKPGPKGRLTADRDEVTGCRPAGTSGSS